MAEHVELFTDGACSGNPGPGGWAFLLRHLQSRTEREASGGEPKTTNNRMELIAVIQGLQALKQHCRVDLYADSQYVVNGLTTWMDEWKAKGWKRDRRKKVINLDLWKQLDELRKTHDIRAKWVRGHANHPENERCDQMAVEAMERFKSEPPEMPGAR